MVIFPQVKYRYPPLRKGLFTRNLFSPFLVSAPLLFHCHMYKHVHRTKNIKCQQFWSTSPQYIQYLWYILCGFSYTRQHVNTTTEQCDLGRVVCYIMFHWRLCYSIYVKVVAVVCTKVKEVTTYTGTVTEGLLLFTTNSFVFDHWILQVSATTFWSKSREAKSTEYFFSFRGITTKSWQIRVKKCNHWNVFEYCNIIYISTHMWTTN